MDSTTILIGTACIGLLLIAGTIGLIVVLKRTKAKQQLVKTKFIGIRPSTMQVRIRDGQARQGRFVWQEPGLEADVVMDGTFAYDSPDGKVVFVDLDTYQPIRLDVGGNAAKLIAAIAVGDSATVKQVVADAKPPTADQVKAAEQQRREAQALVQALAYRGNCANDADLVNAIQKDGTSRKIPPVWRRLSGDILNRVRKDQRWSQLNNIGGLLWQFLQKATPWLVLLCVVLLIVVVIIVATAAGG